MRVLTEEIHDPAPGERRHDDHHDRLQLVFDMLNMNVHSCSKISRSRSTQAAPYKIDSDCGTFVLKFQRQPRTALQSLRRKLLGSPTLRRQIGVYQRLDTQQFTSLNYPRLVKTDNETFVLLTYIPHTSDHPKDLELKRRIVASLIEYQTCSLNPAEAFVMKPFLHLALSPFWTVFRQTLTRVRRQYGSALAISCLKALWTCRQRQSPLDKPIWLHNDFHHNNVLVDKHGNVYIHDFEQTVAERRWVLIDIAHQATDTATFSIDLDLIRLYVDHLKATNARFGTLNYAAQLRFALLHRCLQHLISKAPPDNVKQQYLEFISTILVPEEAFRSWYAESVRL